MMVTTTPFQHEGSPCLNTSVTEREGKLVLANVRVGCFVIYLVQGVVESPSSTCSRFVS